MVVAVRLGHRLPAAACFLTRAYCRYGILRARKNEKNDCSGKGLPLEVNLCSSIVQRESLC